MASIAEQLAEMAVDDSLKHAAVPADLTNLPWAVTVGSWSEVNGWSPPGFSATPAPGSRAGLYWNTEKITGGYGATIVQWGSIVGGLLNERQLSAWLFANVTDATADGYQLVAYQTLESEPTDNIFTFKLRKWINGVETLISENVVVSLEPTGSFSLVKYNGKVSVWVKKNEASPWTLVGAEIADAQWTEGYSGFDGNGSNPRLINFATGKLTTVGETIVNLNASTGSSSASLAPLVNTIIPLNAAAGKATPSVALTAPTVISLEPSFGHGSSEAALTGSPGITLVSSIGVGAMSLTISSASNLSIQSSGSSTANLAFTVPTKVTLNSSSGASNASLLIGFLSTAILVGPNDPTSGQKAVFNLIAYEPNCTFLVSFDGGPWEAPSGKPSNFETNKTICTHEIPGIELGKHTFEAKAINAAKEEDETSAKWLWERKIFLTKANSMYFDVVDNHRFTRSDVLIDFPDSELTIDYTPVGTFEGSRMGTILKMVDSNNYIWAYIGKANEVKMGKVEEGVSSEFAPTKFAFARVLGSKYRVKFQMEDGVITVLHGEYPEQKKVAEFVMSAPDKEKFGAGITGHVYVDLTPGSAEWLYDNLVYSSNSLDDREIAVVVNKGNSDAEPHISLTGPMTAPVLTNQDAIDDNKKSIIFKSTAVIPAGETWEIDVEKGTLRDEEGNNKFDELDPTSGWMTLVPGANHILLSAGATGSEIVGSDELASAVSFAYRHSWF